MATLDIGGPKIDIPDSLITKYQSLIQSGQITPEQASQQLLSEMNASTRVYTDPNNVPVGGYFVDLAEIQRRGGGSGSGIVYQMTDNGLVEQSNTLPPQQRTQLTQQALGIAPTAPGSEYLTSGLATPYLSALLQGSPLKTYAPGSLTQTTPSYDATASVTNGPTAGATSFSNGDLVGVLGGVIDNMAQQGMVINPNKELTSADVAQFVQRASAEVSPYYAEQLKIALEGYTKSVQNDLTTTTQNEKNLEQKYGSSLRSLGESAADMGFAQSGLRQRDERQLATDTQNQINEGRRKLQFDTGNNALKFASTYGSRNLPSFQIGTTPEVSSGQSNFGRQLGSSNLYNISDGVLNDIVGSQEKEKATGIRDLAQFYESQYRTGQTIPTTRTLTI